MNNRAVWKSEILSDSRFFMDREISQQRNYKLVIQAVASSVYAEGDELDIQTTACLRYLPSRRSVWQASCHGRQILLKVYDCHPKQGRDAEREWKHAIKLYQDGLPVSAPLFTANSDDGLVAVAYEFIPNEGTLAEHLAGADESGRREVLRQLIKLHAQQHEAGCFQSDDHLGNYLWSEGTLFMLDTGSCVMKSGPLGLEDRVSNMALLTANISLLDRSVYDGEFTVYFDHCPDNIDSTEFNTAYRKAFPKAIRKRLQDYRRKTRRSSSKLERVNFPGKRWHACRDMDESLKAKLLDDPDQFFGDTPLLKGGNTCSVVSLEMAGREYVLKRYNRKSLCYRIFHLWMPVRALESWTGGHALRLFGIPTPRPVACLMIKSGLMMNQAYLLMEKVSGRLLGGIGQSEMIQTAEKFALMWHELDELKSCHGDMKASNFILADDGTLTLIDLDSIKFYRSTRIYGRNRKKELIRFMRNWKNQPNVQAAIRNALEKL
ncbi:MAG: lipopolysaccharide kinase InaA family protein [Akkermansiaceae bacterium]